MTATPFLPTPYLAVDLDVLDSGHHRTGVAPEPAGEVAVAAARADLHVRGHFTFPGHGYGPGAAVVAAADEARALDRAAAVVRAAGVPMDVVSGGSTPTVAHTPPGGNLP